jgi:lysophospholipase L1-like esterase
VTPRFKKTCFITLLLIVVSPLVAVELESLPSDPYFADIRAIKAPPTVGLLLKQGDRLSICGDSITEQKMYSRIIETYLTVCMPQLQISVRQHGWSGEQAPGLLRRMDNDVLRFQPTIATTCYAMNDHRYQPYREEYGETYRKASRQIIRKFKESGTRVIQGSAGPVGKMPSWVKQAQGTVKDLNLSLLEFRNIDVRLAQEEMVAFADVFLPMLVQGHKAQRHYGKDYMIAGKDGVHPGWAGQVVMAYAFLTAMGLDGNIGTVTVDMAKSNATASRGHRILNSSANTVDIESSRYPFCASGKLDSDGSMRSGMALVDFDTSLNRLMLVVKNATPPRLRVTWGERSKTYSSASLAQGINLAAEFVDNPFSSAFKRVDEAVAKKQAYETRQMKTLFHGPEGRIDMEATVALTEKTRVPLAQAVHSAFKPVKHTIRIEAN